jgi:hypothetical protein
MTADTDPDAQLEGFMARYTPEIAGRAAAILERMRARLPGAVEMVYDNYNALVVGFGATERASEAVFSIALYPCWVTLCFLTGAGLPDAEGRLQGTGKQVRSVVLAGPETLDEPAVRALMAHALERSPKPLDPSQPRRIVIKSVSAKQRPRWPR